MELTEVQISANMILEYASRKQQFIGAYTHKKSGLQVLISKDMGYLHISISLPHRYPSWDEIKMVKYKFYPDVEMAMYFPPLEQYVNYHKNCFHLWEVKLPASTNQPNS